jgi:RNA polymerase sigma factor (TIGR02999 family)
MTNPNRAEMKEASTRAITMLLKQVNEGGNEAFARLIDMVYSDLRRVAANRMRRGFDCPIDSLTEGPTALVHEAILKLRQQHTQWKNGDQFFAIATRLLNHVIGDYRRRRLALKRGGGNRHQVSADLLNEHPGVPHSAEAHETLDDIAIIQALHEHYPRQAEVVTLRFLTGRSMPEIAAMIGVSLVTVERDWKFARAWMRDHLESKGVSP